MKTMKETVESIENKNLWAFAGSLQKKMEQVRIAIMQKKVSGAEKSALQTSVSEFTERNRGKLPQKVAGLLALTMLTSMLASCDEFGRPGHGQDTNEPTWEETGEQDTIEIPKYEHLEIEKFDGDAKTLEECGLKVFVELDLLDLYTDKTASQVLDGRYSTYKSMYENNEDVDSNSYSDCRQCCAVIDAIEKITDGKENVSLEFSTMGTNWNHKLIMASDTFALVSTDGRGKMYITGITGGKFKNEAGFIDNKTVDALSSYAKTVTYDEVIDYSVKEFFARVYLQANRENGMGEGTVITFAGIENGENGYLDASYNIRKITLFNEYGVGVIKMVYNDGISNNYINELLESESIDPNYVETQKETESWTPMTDPKYEEERTDSLDEPAPDDDPTQNRGEEETTAPETEAEIEPNAD